MLGNILESSELLKGPLSQERRDRGWGLGGGGGGGGGGQGDED